MTDKPDAPKPSDTAAKLKLALEMKKRAAEAPHGAPTKNQPWYDRTASERSKSKPKVRK
jgi:hypothetical protein